MIKTFIDKLLGKLRLRVIEDRHVKTNVAVATED